MCKEFSKNKKEMVMLINIFNTILGKKLYPKE
jgi:hypothetical protein